MGFKREYNIIMNMNKCTLCQETDTEIVRLSNPDQATKTICNVCTNPKCLMFIDLKKVKTWKRN